MVKSALLENSEVFSCDWNSHWADEYIFSHLASVMEFYFLALLKEDLVFFF